MRTIPGDTAFPAAPSEGERRTGLTKREAFAMAAMQGLTANSELASLLPDRIAEEAIKQADAMIAALNAPATP